jgi:hypothetical protein
MGKTFPFKYPDKILLPSAADPRQGNIRRRSGANPAVVFFESKQAYVKFTNRRWWGKGENFKRFFDCSSINNT